MTVNDLMMQTQADFTGNTIVRKEEKEITSIGAAIAAGFRIGYWSSFSQVEEKIKVQKEFKPEWSEKEREKKLKRWKQAVERSIGFGWAQ